MADLDFELEIRSEGGRDYQVAVLRSPAGEARATMRFPFDELALQIRLQALEIALLRSGGSRRRLASPEEQSVLEFGRDLFDALVSGEVRSRFDVSRNEALRQGKALRVKLRFDSPALAALPWEFLYDGRKAEYLALSTSTPLVRYIELPDAIEPLLVTGPLRILGMVASPSDLPALDVEREQLRIQDATKDLQARGLVQIHWLEHATWRDLQQALRREKWHIFHFVGHGGFDPTTDEGLIALVDDDGGTFRLPATELARLLGDHQPLRLAVLNACEGARGSSHDLFSSTAATVVRRGTPAVVAMQYEITDRAAIEFSRSFYEAIADGLPVDIALAEARKSVSVAISNTLEWGTPVLFMRSADGVLFKMRRQKATAADRGPSSAVIAGAEIETIAPPVLPSEAELAEGAAEAVDIAEQPVDAASEPAGSELAVEVGHPISLPDVRPASPDRPDEGLDPWPTADRPAAIPARQASVHRARSRRVPLLIGSLVAAAVIAAAGLSFAGLLKTDQSGSVPSASLLANIPSPSPTPPSRTPTPSRTPMPSPSFNSVLAPNHELTPGNEILSPHGKYKLQLTGSGDLVLIRMDPAPGVIVWKAPKLFAQPGYHAYMQDDGNFTFGTRSGTGLWDSDSAKHPGARLDVQDDGNVVVLDPFFGAELWSSKGSRGCDRTKFECSPTAKYP